MGLGRTVELVGVILTEWLRPLHRPPTLADSLLGLSTCSCIISIKWLWLLWLCWFDSKEVADVLLSRKGFRALYTKQDALCVSTSSAAAQTFPH